MKYIILYVRFILIVGYGILVYGIGVPTLMSMDSTVAVLVGVVYFFGSVPILLLLLRRLFGDFLCMLKNRGKEDDV